MHQHQQLVQLFPNVKKVVISWLTSPEDKKIKSPRLKSRLLDLFDFLLQMFMRYWIENISQIQEWNFFFWESF